MRRGFLGADSKEPAAETRRNLPRVNKVEVTPKNWEGEEGRGKIKKVLAFSTIFLGKQCD